MIRSVRMVESCLGDKIKKPTETEKKIEKVITKRIVARNIIDPGDIFSDKNICVKRNDNGLKAKEWDKVIGCIANRRYEQDEGIIV